MVMIVVIDDEGDDEDDDDVEGEKMKKASDLAQWQFSCSCKGWPVHRTPFQVPWNTTFCRFSSLQPLHL